MEKDGKIVDDFSVAEKKIEKIIIKMGVLRNVRRSNSGFYNLNEHLDR